MHLCSTQLSMAASLIAGQNPVVKRLKKRFRHLALSRTQHRQQIPPLIRLARFINLAVSCAWCEYPVLVGIQGRASPLLLNSRMGLTAADIPSELFPYILSHVGEVNWLPNVAVRKSGVRNCSLVCLYWAQQCRRALFHKKRMRLTSMEQVVGLRNMILSTSSNRLIPAVEVIATMDVWHNSGRDDRSWLHIIESLFPLLPPTKLSAFIVQGPSSLPLVNLRSPYRGTPKCSPYIVKPYRRLELSGLRFASLLDIPQFISHFTQVDRLWLGNLSWDTYTTHNALARPRTLARMKNRIPRRIVIKGCHDNASLWELIGFGSQPGSLTLSAEDRAISLRLITDVYAAFSSIMNSQPGSKFMSCELTDYGTCHYRLARVTS